ncbi:acyl carrier protein [Anaerotignum sp.]|uniref:acyl carrier protein n=1 Tax=Anaerotignum sp. TaxID=2039241 RepID=UPI00333270AE
MKFKEEILKSLIADIFGVDDKSINEDTSIDTVDEWDSIKHLNLILALESEFDVTFSEQETVEILNYPLIVLTLKEHGIEFI